MKLPNVQATSVAVVRRGGRHLPSPLLHAWVRWAVGEREVALCLHRVSGVAAVETPPRDVLVCPAEVLDELADRAKVIGGRRRWLTMSFDDGYPDALAYIASRAPRHREIVWRAFVCPDKAIRGRGFRWDGGLDYNSGLPADLLALGEENDMPALRAAGASSLHRVASAEEVLALMDALPGVVGNHTNSHLPLAKLPPAVARAELEGSLSSFESVFGPTRSFAFPFGGEGEHWTPAHLSQLQDRGVGEIWSVSSHTFTAAERQAGSVLPRFPVDGRDDAKTIVALIGLSATVERLRGIGHSRRPGSSVAAARPPRPAGCGYESGQALVPLAPGPGGEDGSDTPFVLVHGASGHVENFRLLADLLCGSGPVYGLRALGVLEGEEPAATVAEAVEIAVDAVKQLGQPVHLVGYSLGGVFALQIAHALEGTELLAGPVTLIDTYDTALELLPLAARIGNAVAFGRAHGVAKLQRWVRRLVERQVRGLLGRPQAAQPWRAELGFGDVTELGLVNLEPHIRAMTAGLAGLARYDGPVRSLRSAELAPNLPADAGIGHLLGTVPEVELLAGDHFSLFIPPYLNRLAAALRA